MKSTVKKKKKSILIIGAGRLGTTLASVLSTNPVPDLKVRYIASRTEKSLIKAKKIIGKHGREIVFTKDMIEGVKDCGIIFICTPDDEIEKVCNNIAKNAGISLKGKYFIHFSGSKRLEVLRNAKKLGAYVASIHPMKSFASIEDSIRTIAGTVYGITFGKTHLSGESMEAKNFIINIVESLGGTAVEVKDDDKPLYHAAACVASNYLVSLINYAVEINEKIGIKSEDALKGLIGLIESTVNNIKELGTKKSLTGPIARGDTGTIKDHLDNFKKNFEKDDYLLYKVLGLATSKIAYKNKWISRRTFEEFKTIFMDSM
ncbi:MAG: DUF2520 domain-containing protein [Actinobacteria bacterium]|nr:DUF2520 domain-containing protein [Actinomycetota bacterium]